MIIKQLQQLNQIWAEMMFPLEYRIDVLVWKPSAAASVVIHSVYVTLQVIYVLRSPECTDFVIL